MAIRVYFDTCALKRPWDDQSQQRIALETSLMVRLLGLVSRGSIIALRSPAHDDENALNSNPGRARRVGEWLAKLSLPPTFPSGLPDRARLLHSLGLEPFDALHLAWAEALGADVLATTDDRLIRRASRTTVATSVRVVGLSTIWAQVSS